MPIYLCRPGAGTKEPWRHGVQVHDRPFPIDGDDSSAYGEADDGGDECDNNHQVIANNDVSLNDATSPPTNNCFIVAGSDLPPEQVVVVLTTSGSGHEEEEEGRKEGTANLTADDQSKRQVILLATMRRYLMERLANPVLDKVIIFCNNNSNNIGGEGASWVAQGLKQDGFNVSTLYWKNNSSGSCSSNNETTIAKLIQFIQSSSSSSSSSGGDSNSNILVIVSDTTTTTTTIESNDDDNQDMIQTVENIILGQYYDNGHKSIAMVINLDLHTLGISRYITRLHITSGILVSIFFLPESKNHNDGNLMIEEKDGGEDGEEAMASHPSQTMAGELVNVLCAYNQHVSRELLSLAPPPLLIDPPPMTIAAVNDAIDDGVDDLLDDLLTIRGRGATTTTLRNRRAQQQPVYHRSGSNQREASNYSSEDDSENDGDHSPGVGGSATRTSVRQQSYGGIETSPGGTDGICRVVDGKVATERGYNNDEKNNRRGRKRGLYNNHHNIGRPPVRRIKHSEVVLVDQALRAYGRTWLRLRWPGEQGGFGGFVALGNNVDGLNYSSIVNTVNASSNDEGHNISQTTATTDSTAALHATTQTTLLCQETGINYPTSALMKLLPLYDDGLQPRGRRGGVVGQDGMIIGETLLIGSLVEVDHDEPVFCRICREGLHDVDYSLETPTSTSLPQLPPGGGMLAGGESRNTASAVMGDDAAVITSTAASAIGKGGGGASHDLNPFTSPEVRSQQEQGRPHPAQPTLSRHLSNLPPIVLHHPTAENPLLAPCDCTGTMAFVHYLCIEQWRCRSRHPGALNGLNCETCGAEYTLPPPPSRPTSRYDIMNGGLGAGGPNNNVLADDEWLDAMPPHVLAALRRPHPAWQFGAAVVRRRWLRPIVPIFVSPLVALYCRARRTLKKRGVSRRRWACSLCRRRARWKCVRCLRSYYCSRQCQNVSWHIVHKHVCYKPQRFWWSLVVYTILICLTVPKLIENFPIYDAAVTIVPVNFIALGIIGGGIASTLKRILAVDIRGRILEFIVVTLTLLLTCITSGLVQGYFGDSSQCLGILAASPIENGERSMLRESNVLIGFPLRLMKLWYLKWDAIISNLGIVSRRLLCVSTPENNDYSTVGCFPMIHSINPEFYLDDQCSADMSLVICVLLSSLWVFLIGYVYRQLRGARRNNDVVVPHRGHRRPHED